MPSLSYRVSMSQPTTHLFEVLLRLEGWTGGVLDLYLPVWTPGSYLVREYAKHVQEFSAGSIDSGSQHPLPWCKQRKNHWQIQIDPGPSGKSDDAQHDVKDNVKPDTKTIEVTYRVFANELTVRTNHLDLTHGYFNPAALLMYVPELVHQPLRVTIVPPPHELAPGWTIATPLSALPDQPNTFEAANYDELVDSPFEVGLHKRYGFEVWGKPHEWVIWGKGNLDPLQLITDTQKIIQTEAEIFGDLPYDRYLFLLHLSANGYGGLEHKQACSLLYPRLNLQELEKYQRFLQLVAHEFFHLWNVKRIRPKALETFDYTQENYTESLWFCEGVTSYYDLVIPQRAGLYSASRLLDLLSKEITLLQTIPGRGIQPLSESSFDAWIKLYRRDANSPNCQISYYLKGSVVTFLLDLLIRQRHRNQRSFDDVLRHMWFQFGKDEKGYTASQLQEVIENVAEVPLDQFFHYYIYGTEELPFADCFDPFGLRLHIFESDVPHTGLKIQQNLGQTIVQFVETNSPAEQAGIEPGDEVLAIDRFRVNADTFNDRLKGYAVGATIDLTLFHADEIRSCALTLAAKQPVQYKIMAIDNPSQQQLQLLEGWLGKL